LRKVMLNHIRFTLLPFIDGNFFDDIQDWFQITLFKLIYPTIFVCFRCLTFSDMYLQSVLRIIAFSDVTNFVSPRISEGIDEGVSRAGLVLWGILGYSVTHGTSPISHVSSRRRMLAHRFGKTLLPPQYITNQPLEQLHAILPTNIYSTINRKRTIKWVHSMTKRQSQFPIQ